MKLFLLLSVGMLGLFACDQPDTAAPFDRKAIKNEVETMFGNYFRDIKKDGLTENVQKSVPHLIFGIGYQTDSQGVAHFSEHSRLTAEFAYLDHSDDFFWVPPGYTSALTYDSVRAILTANAKGFRSIDYQWERVQINPLSPDLAAYTGIVSGATVDTAGTTTRMVLAESGVVIRRKDGWKLLCGQSAHLPTPGRE